MKIATIQDVLTSEEIIFWDKMIPSGTGHDLKGMDIKQLNDIGLIVLRTEYGNKCIAIPSVFIHVETLRILTQRCIEKNISLF